MAIENNFDALCYQVDQLYKLAKQRKIDWSIVHEATTARDKLHAELSNVDNKICQMIDVYKDIINTAV